MALASFCGYKAPSRGAEIADYESESANIEENSCLAIPPVIYQASSCGYIITDEGNRPLKMNFAYGTTTLAFKFQDGVMVAADSRATLGTYIGSGGVRKIIEINKFLLGTMAGGAADCSYWERVLSKQCRLFELRNKKKISVTAASKLLCNIAYNHKGLNMGTMVAGYDEKGPGLFYVDQDAVRLDGNLFSVGSGSYYAFGVLDQGYRYDLTNEEAYDLCRRAIYHATFRDSASGGVIRIYHMKQTGFEVISEEDCFYVHQTYEGQKNAQ